MKDDPDEPKVKKDEADSDDDNDSGMKKKEEAEALEVRDVTYNLEILVVPKLATMTFETGGTPKIWVLIDLGVGKWVTNSAINTKRFRISDTLRKQLAMKDRNLKTRNITWVFDPVPWHHS